MKMMEKKKKSQTEKAGVLESEACHFGFKRRRLPEARGVEGILVPPEGFLCFQKAFETNGK